jgi:hypothetical protein
MVLYCSILLHSSLNCDQFTVVWANTCQFLNIKFKILNFKVLKLLKITTCFGQYRHHQVLKSSEGNYCYSAVVTCVPLMRKCVLLGVSCSGNYCYSAVVTCVPLIGKCVLLCVSCSLLFFVACFVLLLEFKMLTPDDGHIGWNMWF